MLTYTERATELAANASVAVQVLMGAPDDVELISLKPKMADERWLAELRNRWPGRGLRSVGVFGLCGMALRCELKEMLEPEQVSAIADSFLAHLHVLFCDSLEAAETAELELLYALADTRLTN